MPLRNHDIADVVDEILLLEGNDVVGLHEIADRHRLVDETRRCVGIIRGDHDDHAVLLCEIFDCRGNIGTLTDDNAVGPVVHR